MSEIEKEDLEEKLILQEYAMITGQEYEVSVRMNLLRDSLTFILTSDLSPELRIEVQEAELPGKSFAEVYNLVH